MKAISTITPTRNEVIVLPVWDEKFFVFETKQNFVNRPDRGLSYRFANHCQGFACVVPIDILVLMK